MAEDQIGQKEKITILGLEYNALRSEINARTSSIYQVVGILAAVTVWALTQSLNAGLIGGLALAVIGIATCAWFLTRDIVKASFRVQDLEREINRRAGETLLVWENEFGGLGHGYFQFGYFLRLMADRRAKGKR
jgi:hypothetical protein